MHVLFVNSGKSGTFVTGTSIPKPILTFRSRGFPARSLCCSVYFVQGCYLDFGALVHPPPTWKLLQNVLNLCCNPKEILFIEVDFSYVINLRFKYLGRV